MDDPSHQRPDRLERDVLVEGAFRITGLPPLRLYVEAQESRLGRIEEQHIEDQEAAAAIETEKAEEEKAERSEWRKYKWGIIFFGTTCQSSHVNAPPILGNTAPG